MNYPAYVTYKDSEVTWLGSVPEHWEIRSLKRLVSLKSGEAIDSTCIEDTGDYSVFGGNGFRGFTGSFTHDGDYVLIGRQGALCGNINYASGKFWASEHAVVVYPLHSVATTWLGELLRAMNLNQYSVSAAQPGLSVENITNLHIPVPPNAEQEAISNFLDHETAKIDWLIAKQKRLIELLKEKRQAVISHAVTKGHNPDAPMKDSGVEWLGEMPVHWVLKRLKHVSPRVGVGLVINPSAYVVDEGVPFLFGGNVVEYGFKLDNTRKMSKEDSDTLRQSRLSAGDLVCVRVGYPGITAVVTPELEGSNCASIMVIKAGNFDSDWLCYAMNCWVGRRQVEWVQYGAAQKQYNISDAVEFIFPVPSADEQSAIAGFLNERLKKFDVLIEKAEEAIALQKEHRTALISAAVTGKIDVRCWQKPDTELEESAAMANA